MKLINKCERDYLGMLDLDKLKIRNINYLRNGQYNNFSFTYENEKYFFKKCSSIKNIYNELIAEEIA